LNGLRVCERKREVSIINRDSTFEQPEFTEWSGRTTMISRRDILLAGVAGATALGFSLPALAEAYSDAAFMAAKASGKPFVIEFHADWCPTCRAQAPVLRSLSGGKFIILTVNFDDQKNVVKKFGVRRQSTLIVFKEGQEVGRAVGITGEAAIAELLAKAG
jgi:thiol-disulfide isomerase/thioredoxin